MNNKLKNAKGIYIDGILNGHFVEAVNKYTGNTYKQHSTGVKDGKAGFIEFFTDFISRNPERHIDLVRTLVDGNYVFVHAYQSLNNGQYEWITTDFFDTDDNDKLIEHWDVISKFHQSKTTPNNSINGISELSDLNLTEQNKQTIQQLFNEVLLTKDYSKLPQYIDQDISIHHEDSLNGITSYSNYLKDSKNPKSYNKNVLLIGQGNFVATLNEVNWGQTSMAQVDLFRLENNKVVEVWINSEVITEDVLLYNSGKF